MKKILSLSLVIILALTLTGCFLKKESGEPAEEMGEELQLSEDDSLETIEQELEATTLDGFEEELDSLDEEINQL